MCAMAAIASLDRKCTLMILHRPSAVWLQGTAAFCLEFFASSFFLLQLLAASTMMDEYNFPEGWKLGKKEEVFFEWRCPFGDMCGNHQKVLFKRDARDDVLAAGTLHLFNKGHHPDPTFTWAEGIAAIEQSVSQKAKEVYIMIDEEGNEHETKGWKGTKGKSSGKVAKPKWDPAAEYGRRRNRSRSRTYYRHPDAGSAGDNTIRQSAQPEEEPIHQSEVDDLMNNMIDRMQV